MDGRQRRLNLFYEKIRFFSPRHMSENQNNKSTTSMMIKSALQERINNYLKQYPKDSHAQKTLDFLESTDDFWQRSTLEGHITASAWVVNQSFDKALLTHHLKLDQWFQLGGHIESSDNNLMEACIREVKEESGIQDVEVYSPEIFDIDVHLIPASKKGVPAHFHYDVRILVVVSSDAVIRFDATESKEVRWFDIEDLPHFLTSESVLRMARKTVARSTA